MTWSKLKKKWNNSVSSFWCSWGNPHPNTKVRRKFTVFFIYCKGFFWIRVQAVIADHNIDYSWPGSWCNSKINADSNLNQRVSESIFTVACKACYLDGLQYQIFWLEIQPYYHYIYWKNLPTAFTVRKLVLIISWGHQGIKLNMPLIG